MMAKPVKYATQKTEHSSISYINIKVLKIISGLLYNFPNGRVPPDIAKKEHTSRIVTISL